MDVNVFVCVTEPNVTTYTVSPGGRATIIQHIHKYKHTYAHISTLPDAIPMVLDFDRHIPLIGSILNNYCLRKLLHFSVDFMRKFKKNAHILFVFFNQFISFIKIIIHLDFSV